MMLIKTYWARLTLGRRYDEYRTEARVLRDHYGDAALEKARYRRDQSSDWRSRRHWRRVALFL
jgi:hypothetical protein